MYTSNVLLQSNIEESVQLYISCIGLVFTSVDDLAPHLNDQPGERICLVKFYSRMFNQGFCLCCNSRVLSTPPYIQTLKKEGCDSAGSTIPKKLLSAFITIVVFIHIFGYGTMQYSAVLDSEQNVATNT